MAYAVSSSFYFFSCLRKYLSEQNILRPKQDAVNEGEKGFTLVELVVVAVLLAMMSAILYSTINSILSSKSLVERQREVDREAQYILDRMVRELTSRVAIGLSVSSRKGSSDEKDTSTSGGSSLLTTTAQPYIEGNHKKNSHSTADTIRFVSTGTGQSVVGGFSNAGLVEIRYSLEKRTDHSDEHPKDGLESMLLVREEYPADVDNEKIRKNRKVSLPLANDIVGLSFRYMKDSKWQQEWKNQYAKLPEAIEITLKIRGADEAVETYRTAVSISKAAKKQ